MDREKRNHDRREPQQTTHEYPQEIALEELQETEEQEPCCETPEETPLDEYEETPTETDED